MINSGVEDAERPKITAITPWFGGKRTLAPEIVTELGPHRAYFEPFCGSMAVLFAKLPCQLETVNDMHGGLICLARVLADSIQSVRLYEMLSRTLFSEDLLQESQRILLETGDNPPWINDESASGENPQPTRADEAMCDYAYQYFLASWMARNGTAGTERINYQPAVRWGPTGGSPTTRWQSAIESIPWWHYRLRNAVILRRDAFDIIPRFDDATTTAIYVDPPYYTDSRTGIANASCRYLYDFKEKKSGRVLFETKPKQSPHERLASQLREFKHARILVSYYDCPEVRALYPGWTVVDKAMRKNMSQMGGYGDCEKSAPEILLINGPSFAA